MFKIGRSVQEYSEDQPTVACGLKVSENNHGWVVAWQAFRSGVKQSNPPMLCHSTHRGVNFVPHLFSSLSSNVFLPLPLLISAPTTASFMSLTTQ